MSKQIIGFASKSLREHFIRGLIGAAAIVAGMYFWKTYPLVSFACLGIMVLAFRGCPVCWSIGLFETSCQIKPGKTDARPEETKPSES